jgi:mannose-1-phosphate guanylyltransferase
VDGNAAQVRGFWEKPTPEIAQKLFERGGFWNTFIMVGAVRAFLRMIETALPELYRDFHSAAGAHQVVDAYRQIEPFDFSRQVLPQSAERLLMTPLRNAGWSDLGDPRRANEVRSLNRKPVSQETGAPPLAAAVAGSGLR